MVTQTCGSRYARLRSNDFCALQNVRTERCLGERARNGALSGTQSGTLNAI
jgi:hypothetical protein